MWGEKMDNVKQLIVDCICTSVNVDFPEKKYTIDLDSTNYAKDLRGDIINTNLKKMFNDKKYIVHEFQRGGWEGRIALDLENKVLLSVTTKNNLYNIPKKKDRMVPHYMQTILEVLNDKIGGPIQMTLPNVESIFDKDTYDLNFKNITNGIEINLEEFTYYIVTYDYKSQGVIDIEWILLNKDFNIVEKVNLNSLMKTDYADLTEDTTIDGEDISQSGKTKEERQEGVKLGLKKEKKIKGA